MNNSLFNKTKKIFINIIFAVSLLFFFISFNFQDNRSGGWYLQYLPNLNNAQVNDIYFIDSLIGFFCTSVTSGNSYICKTTNGGDNWSIKRIGIYPFQRIIFYDNYSGFCNAFDTLYKTTDKGETWLPIKLPTDLIGQDMSVLNKDTLWLVNSQSLVGGIFRTTNGGQNWTVQYSQFGNNPKKIYMYNRNIGFAGDSPGDTINSQLWKTTNSGLNWNVIPGAKGFRNMYFIDSLTGWKANDNIQKTTNGGLNWKNQIIPKTNYIFNNMLGYSATSRDTMYGVGGSYIYYPGGNGFRGVIYKTTNGGENWGYQIPDTSMRVPIYILVNFINNRIGWAFYHHSWDIRTIKGGDDTLIFTNIKNKENINANKFILHQNYPNPFNTKTIINYQLSIISNIKLRVFNITGKEIIELVNKKQNPGIYKVTFDGSNFSSGIYFYRLEAEDTKGNIFTETKKLILLK